MASDYAHQCRYCVYCVVGNIWWCSVTNKGCKYHPTRPNRCDKFLFNEIPADDVLSGRVYRPRKKSQFKQPKLFCLPTDKKKKEGADNGK